MKIDAGKVPVMKKHCKSCPFKPNDNGSWLDTKLANVVISRTLFKANQICHSTQGMNGEPNHRCKGAYDYNRMIYKRMGLDLKLIK